MWIWHRGAAAISVRMHEALIPVADFMARIAAGNVPRYPARPCSDPDREDTPPVMLWHVRHNRALHEHLFVLRVDILPVPWISSKNRIRLEEVAPNFWRAGSAVRFHGASAYSGIAHHQQIAGGVGSTLMTSRYYVGHETVISREDGKGLPAWQEGFFAVMERNAIHVSDFFQPAQRSGGSKSDAGFD